MLYTPLIGYGSLRMRSVGRRAQYGEGRLGSSQIKQKELTRSTTSPQKVGLSEYLASLTRVNEGLITLKKSNLRSTQKAVQQMTGLLKTGSLQLEELFRQTLAEDSKPLEPLHYITKRLSILRLAHTQ